MCATAIYHEVENPKTLNWIKLAVVLDLGVCQLLEDLNYSIFSAFGLLWK